MTEPCDWRRTSHEQQPVFGDGEEATAPVRAAMNTSNETRMMKRLGRREMAAQVKDLTVWTRVYIGVRPTW